MNIRVIIGCCPKPFVEQFNIVQQNAIKSWKHMKHPHVENIRIKESDRILAVATELRKMGIKVIEHRDGLDIEGKDRVQPATIETYDDHRIAMAFSVTGLKTGEITIKDPGCVAKTYPTFFQDLFRLCGTG